MINEIHIGDCLDIMKQIPSESVDMVLCDLPYGTTGNKWDSVIELKSLWAQYNRVCKTSAAILLTASQPFTSRLIMSNESMYRHEWIWIKNRGSNFANTVREPMKEHESVLMFSKGKWTYNKQMQERTGSGTDRVKYNLNFRSKSKNYRDFEGREKQSLPKLRVPSSWQKFNTDTSGLHPTIKPLELFRYMIRTYSNEEDVILDNCIGSGTTAVAALAENREFIGIEKDPEYAAMAVKRVLMS